MIFFVPDYPGGMRFFGPLGTKKSTGLFFVPFSLFPHREKTMEQRCNRGLKSPPILPISFFVPAHLEQRWNKGTKKWNGTLKGAMQ